MTWVQWVLVGLFAFDAVGSVLLIGQPRPVRTPSMAAVNLVINALLILGVVFLL